MKDELAGKRIRCATCQAVIKVEPTDEPEETESAVELPTRAHSRKKSSRAAGLNPLQKLLVFATKNPWFVMLALFVGMWVPISLAAPVPFMVINTLTMLLCWLGVVVGIILAFAGVAIKNPFQVLTMITVGAIASQMVPLEQLQAAGVATGKAARNAGMKDLGAADTGMGGQMAVYCGILSVILLGHIVALSFVMASRLE
ncbi:MAG: hypothetical protein B7Z55_02220 [Planctomycetales bacterium 12-60-4]|nr:MAG: hypothetical protein B7Z55_02220 [Planctomycetales bacterium 12-60-4]